LPFVVSKLSSGQLLSSSKKWVLGVAPSTFFEAFPISVAARVQVTIQFLRTVLMLN
jgi:hypothetical protein